MTELLTAAQMRAIEQAAIASGEVTGLELMERAGRGVVEAIFEEWPELRATSHRAVVLCGPGNNGGDGFVVARLLKEWGWEVEVFLYGDPERMPPDARVNYERWRGMGEVSAWDDAQQKWRFEEGEPEFDLVVDALFGIGLTRPMPDDTDATLDGLMPGPLSDRAHEPGQPRFVAVDIPSGLCSDSGKSMGSMPTHLTVTFHRPKLGHYMSDGCLPYGGVWGCHKLSIVDIGLKSRTSRDAARLVSPQIGRLRKLNSEHKYSHGHAVILSGPSGRGGAARLAARGALRIGAGVVTVGCPPEAIPENAARLDAVMLRGVADGLALEEALVDARINALCVGPGLGLDARGREVVAVALGRVGFDPTGTAGGGGEPHPTKRPVVLDADALTILSQTPDLFAALHDGCVLTPHAGEFARLFPDIAEKLAAPATKGPAYSKVDATREAAKRAGCVVLYKGPDTVIADPTGRCAINSAHYDRAAPWLATAGSGDVLAGFITGLLARGFSPFDAACTGAWLHVECALSFGPGLIAEDLPEELPKVFRALGL
jgi:hydroxyethylthiazole kinase-like uncharacterized protein yjeF